MLSVRDCVGGATTNWPRRTHQPLRPGLPLPHRANTSSTRGQSKHFSLPTLLCPGSPTSASVCRPGVSPSSSIVGLKTSPPARRLPSSSRRPAENPGEARGDRRREPARLRRGFVRSCVAVLWLVARGGRGSTMAEGRRYAIAPQLGERTQPSS
jgi:hypothetical protein